ncbi:MAG: TonB-dependent receptor [Acidobacteria bacterium]|nr:TonB-dependent receptor [Acidobacteriota bacterium]
MDSQKIVWKVFLYMVCLAGLALAQVTTGTISGTVSDSTGAVIPGAIVAVRNTETGISRTLTTNAQGRYTAPQLGLGMYEVTAEASGFQRVVRSGIEMTVGRQAVVDFGLQVGAVTELITVTGEAPLLETTNATIANLVTEREMRELPLNGRSFTDLTAIQPGAITDLGMAQSATTGMGGRIVLNGARPQQSSYLLDGADVVNPATNTPPVSVMGQALGVDTIREFTVLQSNYGAQYGRALGGVVNAVTRSGTNEIHGSAFEFLRNENLDAKNFFDLPDCKGRDPDTFRCDPIPPYKRNNFGGTIGGPIVRDNTFFFFSYEGVREVFSTTDNGQVLSDETRVGQITGCPAGITACTKAEAIVTEVLPLGVNPDIQPIVNIIPRGNGQYLNQGLQEFKGSRKRPARENYYMFRIDQRLSDNDSLFGRVVIDNSSRELPDAQFIDASKGLRTSNNEWGLYRFVTLEWTRILSPAVLNIARFSFTRIHNQQCQCIDGEETKRVDSVEYPNLPPQLAIIPGVPWGGPLSIPGVSIPGGHNGPGSSATGATLNNPLKFRDNGFNYFDSMRISKGRHSLDLGVDIRRYQENEQFDVWAHAQTSWLSPIKNFLTAGLAPYCVGPASQCRGIGSITAAFGPTGPPDTYKGWRQTYTAWYIQDDFQLLSNLTLNLGLRWEWVTPPVEVNGKSATIMDPLRDTGWTQLGKEPMFELRDALKGFAPRFGFAYSLGQKTSVRGGIGVFREMPLAYLFNLARYDPPYAERLNLRNLRKWPQPLAGVDPATGTRQPLIAVHDMKYPYAFQWNLGIERQLGPTWVARASYLANRGINIMGVSNHVQPAESVDAQGQRFTPLNAPSINPFLDSTRTYDPIGDSWYHSMQLRLQKRISRGLEFSTSYTWSKNLSTVGMGTHAAEGPPGGRSYPVPNMWNFKSYAKGPADQDVPHNFSFNYTYELPIGQGRMFGGNLGKTANLILGGWQINGVFSARSGLSQNIGGPGYSATNYCRTCIPRPNLKPGGDNNPVLGDVDHWFDETQFEKVTPGYLGNVGQNTLRGPKSRKIDFSIFKAFALGEAKNLQFRAEFFNLPNTPNFRAPSTSVFNTDGTVSPTVGRITDTIGTSRQIQLALKFEF